MIVKKNNKTKTLHFLITGDGKKEFFKAPKPCEVLKKRGDWKPEGSGCDYSNMNCETTTRPSVSEYTPINYQVAKPSRKFDMPNYSAWL